MWDGWKKEKGKNVAINALVSIAVAGIVSVLCNISRAVCVCRGLVCSSPPIPISLYLNVSLIIPRRTRFPSTPEGEGAALFGPALPPIQPLHPRGVLGNLEGRGGGGGRMAAKFE